MICALSVDKCEQCIYSQNFHEIHASLLGLNNLLIFTKKKEPNFPSSADK